MRDVILALDIGSSSIRCTAYESNRNDDVQFSLQALSGCSASSQRQSVQPNSGKIRLFDHHDDDVMKPALLDTVDELVEQVLGQLRTSSTSFQVVAVGVSSFVMNLVAVDATTGRLLGNECTVSYACNSAAAVQQCQQLRNDTSNVRLQELYQATGAPLHTAYAIPQLRALHQNDDDTAMVLSSTPHIWQTLASHCIARWTGRLSLPITYSEASWTGLLNVDTCTYDSMALDFLPTTCREALPPLADYHDYISGIPQHKDTNDTSIVHSYWERFPELRTAKLYLGVGDGACANVGSKCTLANRIAVTIGTSAAARMCLPLHSNSEFSFDISTCQGLFCYRIDRNHVLVGGALTDGGSVVEWAREFLNLHSEQDFEQCLQEIQALEKEELDRFTSNSNTSSPLLLMVPFLSGERSTGFRDGATGAVLGLTRETSSAAFFRSCFEGVTFRLKAVLDLLVACHPGEKEKPIVIASGKAMENNDYWRQMIADASGLSMVFDKETEEGTSRGVARLVALSLYGMAISSCPEKIQTFKVSEPRAVATAMYAQKAERQNQLIDCVAPMF